MIGWIILGVIAFIILLVATLFIISKMKGKAKIELEKYDFSPGETIKGKVILTLKKPLDAKALNIGLRGVNNSTQRSRDGKRRSETRDVFNFTKPLSGKKQYSAGVNSFDFELKIPKDILSGKTIENQAVKTAVTAVQILSGSMSTIKWYVETNLDISGIDLSDRVQINLG